MPVDLIHYIFTYSLASSTVTFICFLSVFSLNALLKSGLTLCLWTLTLAELSWEPKALQPLRLPETESLGLDQWGQINHLTWGQNYQIKPRGLRILYMHEDICDLCLSFVPDRTQFETRKSRWKTEWLFTVLTIPSTWGHPWQLWLRNDHFLPDNSF